MRNYKNNLAMLVVAVLIIGLSSCAKQCTDAYGNAVQCQSATTTGTYYPTTTPTNGNNNGQNTPTNPSAGSGAALFMVDVTALNMVGVAGQGQFYAVTPDYDQNCVPDADALGTAVDKNKVPLSGLISFDQGITSYPSVLICDAGVANSYKGYHDLNGGNVIVSVFSSNVPYGYSIKPGTVNLTTTNLCTKTNSGIYVKTTVGKTDLASQDSWAAIKNLSDSTKSTRELMSPDAEKNRVDAFVKTYKHN
ncbi:MAG: hypothetical protein JWM20_573 [Patescibacteria group bacterium]|nr:hypothetical protein [Patescibacteria group bacterium]